jgi:ATP-dependent Clp protease adaptor protein ClpS
MSRFFAGRDETMPIRVIVRPARTDVEVRAFLRLLPRYRVLLHNDDTNTFGHVIATLTEIIQALSAEEAERIALEAHQTGCAQIIVCLKEPAEHYRDELRLRSLTSSIEPA